MSASGSKFQQVIKAATLSEIQQRASQFKYKLQMRNVHTQIYEYSNSELLTENYFHSVFEAIKGVADRLRAKTGLYADGNVLVDIAFTMANPLIRINLLQNDTQRSEHMGLANLHKTFIWSHSEPDGTISQDKVYN